ncbi:hypothetical protein WR25_05222 [Diploscapter pachys]|uniref:Uncharacterized protein n=1 Tax=Diploscapter pachys TaxID=2018661 RepID=A0A2A2LPW9_9BILA|nr:hypothetical protein WR25_05222 [Diploscapter pachys]
MSALYGLLLFVWVTIVQGRDPIGQNLILILADGFGNSLLNSSQNDVNIGLKAIAENGVTTEFLRPSFPTHSWPNSMSLITGLYPDSHGFSADYMYDEQSQMAFEKGYGINDTEDVWWKGRPAPIWYTAGKKGDDINCYWFAHCHRPYWDLVVKVPNHRWADLGNPQQTDRLGEIIPEVVSRIAKYQSHKQQFFLIRSSSVGNAIRMHGPNSDEAEQALQRFDLHVHNLQQELEKEKLSSSTNLVVIGDHGLRGINEEEQFYLEECLADYSRVKKVVNMHSMVMVFTDPEEEGNVHFELHVCEQWGMVTDYDENDIPLVKAYKLSELPEDLHWKDSRFMSGVILMTKPGVSIITRELPSVPDLGDIARDAKYTGGWLPDVDEMKGFFMARGPAFKVNEKHPPVDMVDVYQVLLNILSIDPNPNNGTWTNVEAMLTEGWEDRQSHESSTEQRIVVFSILFCLITRLLW